MGNAYLHGLAVDTVLHDCEMFRSREWSKLFQLDWQWNALSLGSCIANGIPLSRR